MLIHQEIILYLPSHVKAMGIVEKIKSAISGKPQPKPKSQKKAKAVKYKKK